MVPPERLTPGMRARHWARPMTIASFIDSPSSDFASTGRSCLPNLSAARNTNENTMSTIAVIQRLRAASRMKSLPTNPMIAIGIDPTMTIHPSR